MGRTSTMVPFFTEDIRMREIDSASDVESFNLQGKTIRAFTNGKRCSLEHFDNGAYVVRLENGRFIEFFE
jgi:antitoxin component YwqK of YwqJK toxin-antitoxin module